MERSVKENRFLYMLKGIACIMVVFIHFGFPGSAGSIAATLARFAVPMFFVVAGRYMYVSGTSDGPGLRRRMTVKLLKIICTAAAVLSVYTLYSLIIHLWQGASLREWAQLKYQPMEWLRLAALNASRVIWDSSYVFDFLWYLFAMIWVQLFMIVTLRWRHDVKCAICILLMSLLYVCQYMGFSATVPVLRIWSGDTLIYRNWLFTGIPFALVGVWISKSDIGRTGKPMVWWTVAACGVFIALREAKHFTARELPLGIGMLVAALAVLAEYYPHRGSRVMAFVGKHLSAKVYYWHVLIGNLLKRVLAAHWSGLNESYVFPLLVAGAALLVALGMYSVECKMKKRASDAMLF